MICFSSHFFFLKRYRFMLSWFPLIFFYSFFFFYKSGCETDTKADLISWATFALSKRCLLDYEQNIFCQKVFLSLYCSCLQSQLAYFLHCWCENKWGVAQTFFFLIITVIIKNICSVSSFESDILLSGCVAAHYSPAGDFDFCDHHVLVLWFQFSLLALLSLIGTLFSLTLSLSCAHIHVSVPVNTNCIIIIIIIS